MPEPTWTDYVQLRRSESPAAPPYDDAVRYYSDDDGVLRYLLSDGTTGTVGTGGGGDSDVRVVRLPFSFDTPGINRPVFAVVNANDAHTFEIEAQGQSALVSYFAPGVTVAVVGTSSNDGTYTVTGSVYDPDGENVVATVTEVIPTPDEGGGGFAIIPGPLGIKLCDLAAGETIIGSSLGANWLSFLSVTDAWSIGSLRITITDGRGDLPDTEPVSSLGGPFSLTTLNSDAVGDFPGVLMYPTNPFDPGDGPVIVGQDTSLYVWVSNNDEFAYSTQGEAEIVLLILKAPTV